MRRTAIILAGGHSQRFGQDKGLILLTAKPLVLHVFDRICMAVEEVLIVVSSASQLESYSQLFRGAAKIVADEEDSRGPLMGALTGFVNVHGEYSVLLPCDTPFVSRELLELLFEISPGTDAVIPRWPNGYIEPLQAVYRTSCALRAAREAVEGGEARMRSMIALLRTVRYISTLVIKNIDPHLATFYNINTSEDLREAETLIRKIAT